MGGTPIPAGIVGVSGYSGMELARLLAGHPALLLTFATSDRWAGKPLGSRMSIGGPGAGLRVQPQGELAALAASAQVVFLCTPPEVSMDLAPRLLNAGTRVVDLSGAFRLPAGAYPRWYGFEHAAPEALAEAVYSLPEATGNASAVRQARLVSNPGCYPTASALPLVALLRAGVIEPRGLIVDAKSGTTGAGRKATEAMSFSEVAGDFRAYRVLAHQHTPEIERILALAGCGEARVTFTAHLLPVRRGILATIYAPLRDPGADANLKVEAALRDFAAGRPFLEVLSPEEVTLARVVGTNRVLMSARADLERGVVVAVAAEDNLIKGAAGQAIQNANLMFGLPETTGLDRLSGHAP